MASEWESLRLTKKLEASPFTAKGRQRHIFLSAPVVTSSALCVSDPYGNFSAFDRSSCELLWQRSSQRFEPWRVLDDGLILVGQPLGGNAIGAIAAESGTLIWSLRSPSAGAGLWHRHTVLLFEDKGFRVVDAETGVPQELIEVPGGITNTAYLHDDIAIFGTFERDEGIQTPSGWRPMRSDHGDPVRGFHLVERRIVWERRWLIEMNERFGLSFDGPASVFVPGSLPGYFLTTRIGEGAWGIFGCSLADGGILWYARVSCSYAWPNVQQGRVYVFAPPRFVALDETTGEVIYDVEHPELRQAIHARTGTVYGGRIAFPTESGHLPVFDLSDGRLVWLHKEAATVSGIAEADGRLLATTGRGHLLIFEDTGRPAKPRRS